MSIKRGVVSDYTTTSARPIAVTSTLPIALVLASKTKMAPGIYGYDSLADALEDVKVTRAMTEADGLVLKYLELGDMFNCTAPIIISTYKPVADAAETKTRIIDAIIALKVAPSLAGYKPDIIVAPEAGYDVDIINALISSSEKFGARTFADLDAATNAEALARRNAFGSDRLTLIKSGAIANAKEYDGAALMAWARVLRDGDVDGLGWSRSISNLVLPVSSVKYPSDFVMGKLDETDPLTENQITSIIFHKGFRTWEYSTCSADAIWQDARRVRIFDKISEAVLEGIFFAIDKGMDELKAAKKSLRAFVSDLVGAGVILGSDDVQLDLARTTTTAITKGEFYFIINLQEMPSPRLIKVTFNRVDKFAPVLYEILAAA